MIYSELSGQAGIELSDRDKKELARAIVRHGQRLAIPDGFMLGGYKPIPSLFLYTWAKTRTNFEQKKARGYGILDLPEIFVREMEKKTGSKINREYDILRYSIQYKLVLLRFKELLSESETVSVAYAKLYGNSVQVGEWNLFENNYKKIHEKVIYESKP
jgi:hypothetical protein